MKVHVCDGIKSLNPAVKRPVTPSGDSTELPRRCEISQNAVGSQRNAENRPKLF